MPFLKHKGLFSRQGILWFIAAFLLAAIVSLATTHHAFAATGTWKDKDTITVNGSDYKRVSNTEFKEGGAAVQTKCNRIKFDSNAAYNKTISGTLHKIQPRESGGLLGGGCIGTIASDENLESITVSANSGGSSESGGSDGVADDESDDGKAAVCTIGDALSWFICPVMNFTSQIVDSGYSFIDDRLYINPITVEYGGPLFKTWETMRNIANVTFIIAFLIVIFSQATSFGISAYGIKKMLPRIIVAALLINISFFLCQIALDVSNIIGASALDLFERVRPSNGLDVNALSGEAIILSIIGGVGIAGLTLAPSLVGSAISFFIPVLIALIITILTVVVVIVAREALIILLIAIAPLAFAAYILPNTEKLFDKWKSLFIGMLVFYPMASILLGGSKLASSIMLSTATAADGSSLFTIIAAWAVLIMPLFALPFLLKVSGGILSRVAGIVNDPNKGPFDRMRKWGDTKAEQYNARGERRIAEDVNARGKLNPNRYRRRFQKGMRNRKSASDYRLSADKAGVERAQEEMLANRLQSDQRFLEQVGGQTEAGQKRAYAQAQAVFERRKEEETKNASLALRSAGVLTVPQFERLAAGGEVMGSDGQIISGAKDVSVQRAAMQQLIGAQDAGSLNNLISSDNKARVYQRDAAGNVVRDAEGKPVSVEVDMPNITDIGPDGRPKTAGADIRQLLYEEMQQQYGQTKGAGAHLVKFSADDVATGWNKQKMEDVATKALSSLSWQKLAAQDGPSATLASIGFKRLSRDSAEYDQLYQAAKTASASPEIMAGAKGEVRAALAAIVEYGDQHPPAPSNRPNVGGTPPDAPDHSGPDPTTS